MKPAKELTMEQVMKFLPEQEEIHVFHAESGPQGEVWPKRMVIKHIEKHGAQLAGPIAASRGHGIVSTIDGDLLFIQNKGAYRADAGSGSPSL